MRVGERHEVVGVGGRQRQVHRVEPRGAKRRVVHGRRHRMRRPAGRPRRRARCARRAARNRNSSQQRRARDLPGRHAVARVRPARSEPAGQHARRRARRRPSPISTIGAPPVCAPRSQQRQAVAEPVRRDGDLDDLGAGRAHRLRARRQGRPARRRSREATARCGARRSARCRSAKLRAPLDVDVLGAERQRLGAGCAAAPLRAREAARLPTSGRHVTMTGLRRPGQRAGRRRDRATVSSRSSTRSASATASRRGRSSAIVSARHGHAEHGWSS